MSNMTIELNPVTSSQISAIGWDEATQTLAIQFKPGFKTPNVPGSIYHYENVSKEDYAAFSAAESTGKYFYRHIKPFPQKFPYTKQS